MQIATIVGNWKMNKPPSEARLLAQDIRGRLEGRGNGAKVVVCPPSIALETVSRTLEGSDISVGAQNAHSESSGAFTGEISPAMAREFADFVIVGHSERRSLFGESDEFVRGKVEAAIDAGLRPILCVGESAAVRSGGDAERFVCGQLDAAVSGVSDIAGALVAYEPVWAIGTGLAATADSAQQMLGVIRAALRARFGDSANAVPCLYGGSVTASNIADFVRQPDVDGALVGGASLDAASFADSVTRAAAARG